MRLLLGIALALSSGCSAPDLGNTTFSCDTDADCGKGEVCAPVSGSRACVAGSGEPITIGMSGPLQGPSQDLGNEMRRGIQAMFARVNRQGGVFGRQLQLKAMNDNYDPDQALANTKVTARHSARRRPTPNQPDVRGVELGVRDARQRRHTDDAQDRARREQKSHAVLRAVHRRAEVPARRHQLALRLQLPRRLLPGDRRDGRLHGDLPAAAHHQPPPGGLVQPHHRLHPARQPTATPATTGSSTPTTGCRRCRSPTPASPNPSIARLYYEREDVRSVDPAIAERRASSSRSCWRETHGHGSRSRSSWSTPTSPATSSFAACSTG